jgi:general L-amino acid transport system substrate-binding protein
MLWWQTRSASGLDALMYFNKLPTVTVLALLAVPVNCYADTLQEVLKRGFLRCGITENSPGFSTVGAEGERKGFIIEQCKTLAAAIFGKINVEYVPLTPQTAFVSLQARRIDVFAAGATWTFLRDTSMGLNYTGVSYYAGQGFMVRKDTKISSVEELHGATICITQGSTNEQNVADYFAVRKLEYVSLTFRDMEQALVAYEAGRCDAITTERISLAGRRKSLNNSAEHIVLPDMISKEPIGALVRHGDDRWLDIVVWSFNVRIAAEELGIHQGNVEQMRAASEDPEVQRLLGVNGEFGKKLGLSNDWAYQIIRLVGNYDDIWQRTFAPMGLERGLNDLWSRGGLLSALPFR